MTREEKMAAWIAKHHDSDGWKAQMVYSIWEDGEVTLEKGGELFGWRNLHCLKSATITPWPVKLFPIQNRAETHGRIYLAADTRYESVLAEMQAI